MKRVLNKIKVVFTQIIAFILAFFKDTNLVYVKKVTVRKKITDDKEIEKKEEKEEIVTSVADTTPLPDDDSSFSDSHIVNDEKLNYKQSIANVSDDIKDKVISKIKGKEIYFSEYIVLNTIIEVLEEKHGFKYEDLNDNKKGKIKSIIEEVNNKISPVLKKEMNNNIIKTKDDLKDNISHKIDDLHKINKRVKDVLAIKKKDNNIEEKKEIIEEVTEAVSEPVLDNNTSVKVEEPVHEIKKGIVDDTDDDKFITIEKIDKDKDSIVNIERTNKKNSLITIEKELDNGDDLISIVKADKVESRDKVYFIADLLSTRRDMNVKDTVKTSTNNTIVNDVKKEIAENMQDKSKKLPFVMVPTKEETREEIEEKIRNTEISSTLLIHEESEEDLYKELDKDIEDELNEEKGIVFTTNTNNDDSIETNDIEEIISNKEEIENDIVKLEESLMKVQEAKEEIDDTETELFEDQDKDEKAFIEIKKNNNEDNLSKDIKNISDKADVVIEETKSEIIKENLEDKEYDKYEKEINKLIEEIDSFLNKNRIKMLEKDIKNLKNIKNSLLDVKEKMNKQKEIDIENEKKELEDEIKEEEIQKLLQEIKKLHLEHQTEVDDDILQKLKEMEESNDPKLEEFETALIKKKLKRASKVLEVPTILALPFVRNRYFFYFTVGMLINNHFDFISAIFGRKEKRYEPIDLTPIKNGKIALEESLDITYRNIIYLDVIEEEALTKYPNLINDKEFISYIDKIRNKLNSDYERLEKKQKMLEKYIYKTNKKNKVLKKYKLLKNKETA